MTGFKLRPSSNGGESDGKDTRRRKGGNRIKKLAFEITEPGFISWIKDLYPIRMLEILLMD
jgi:hypothetical protein